jgi:D-alanyl-D-alanine carboxypeptidase
VIAIAIVIGLIVHDSLATKSLGSSVEKKLEKVVNDSIDTYNIPGAVVGVWIPGKQPWLMASGVADIATSRPVKTTDRFRIASITKTFTATVILQLVDEGKLDLEASPNKYLGDEPQTAGVTIKQLLNHTSGLFDYLEDENFLETAVKEPLRKWQPQELLDFAFAHQPYLAPGQGWHYSNTNYIILGRLIEKVTGRKLQQELDSRIFKPLQLKNTSLETTPYIEGEHSEGYFDINGDKWLDDITESDPSKGWAASAVASRLDDMKIWAKALAEGHMVSPRSHRLQLQWVPTAKDSDYLKYGLGIENVAGLIGHEGDAFGFNCSMYYMPSNGATIVVLLNEGYQNGNPADTIMMGLARVLFPQDLSVIY